MNTHTQTVLWIAQRASAAVLAVCVFVHLITIVYAVRGGLSGAEIIDRLNGNPAWMLFYMLFVAAVAIHAPIGLRTVLVEHTRLAVSLINVSVIAIALILLWLGNRAVLALFGG